MDEFNDFLERCENIGNCFSNFSFLFLLLILLFLFIFSILEIIFIFADGFLAGVMSKSMFIYISYPTCVYAFFSFLVLRRTELSLSSFKKPFKFKT